MSGRVLLRVKMQIKQMYWTPLQEVVVLNFYKINVISAKTSSHETASNVKCQHFFPSLKESKEVVCARFHLRERY